MRHTMVILDKDSAYAAKAAAFINSRGNFPFEVIPLFLTEDISENKNISGADIILVCEDRLSELNGLADNDNLIILSENRLHDKEERVIYKYQSCEIILKELLLYASQKERLNSIICRKNQMKIIGLFSPIGRCGRTGFGISLGQILAKNHKTLFLEMDCYNTSKDLLNIRFSGDMSDLLYAMNSNSKDLLSLIGGISGSINSLDIIPSMDRHGDLISITSSEWMQLLKQIEVRTDYEFIILDLSKGIQGLSKMIALCNKLIVTTVEGNREQMIMDRFIKEIESTVDTEKVLRLIKIPYDSGGGIEQFGTTIGEIGECARELAKEIVA